MNIMLLGAAGFLGTNLTLALCRDPSNEITVVSRRLSSFSTLEKLVPANVRFVASELTAETDFTQLLQGQDVVYHLVSTTVPTTSNMHIAEEINANVILSVRLLEACVTAGVKRIIFLSSGGTVYGRVSACPISEDHPTDPISSYGIQKLTIEKLLQLYHHMNGLDYRVIRLANPYGPWQRPNGVLGAVTTFTARALAGQPIHIYGDGSVVRDFLYVDDAVRGILRIAEDTAPPYRLFNLGSGYGTSILDVLEALRKVLDVEPQVVFEPARNVDVPVNFLDISRYEQAYGSLQPLSLEDGIRRTAEFLTSHREIFLSGS